MISRDKKMMKKKARRKRRMEQAKSRRKAIVNKVSNNIGTSSFNKSLWSPNNMEISKKSRDVLNSKKSKIFDKSAWQNPPPAPGP